MNIDNAKYIKLEVNPRYWEDADINGAQAFEDGSNVPFKDGENWILIIRIDDGVIIDWPEGISASFHFKVCDAGTYHLLDENMEKIASRLNTYVPDGLCHGDRGYGDYIIFNVNKNGVIEDYFPHINEEDWS